MRLFTWKRPASGTTYRKRRRWAASLAGTALVVGAVSGLTYLPASAADVTGGLELDGNVLNTGGAPPDWGPSSGTDTQSIFTTTSVSALPTARSPLPTGFLDAGFSRDFTAGSSSDGSTYTGGSKDTLDIHANWRCVGSSNVTDKGDIQNAYAAAYTDPSSGDLMLYFGMEKNASSGDNNMGVWFLQDGSVSCNEGGTGNGNPFSGDHTDGDILLVAAFTNGGTNPTISAYQWQGGASGTLDPTAIVTGSLCGQSTDPAICAITNQSGPISLPWNTQDKNASTTKNKTGLGTSLSADQFYEGAVDLTAKHLDVDSNGDPICVNKFVFDTRSAQSLTATLYDYAIGNVHTCASPTVSTSLRRMIGSTPAPTTDTVLTAASHTVAAGSKVYDTSTLSGALGTPTGTVTYSLWTDSACSVAATSPLFTNTGGGTSNTSDALSLNANGTLPNSPVLTFSSPGNYYWQATYSGGGRNSGATSTCSTEPLTVQAPPPMATTILLSDKVQVEAIGSGPTPTGSVSFTLYPSADCTGTALYGPTSAVSLVNGVATTPVATAVAAGTYSWKVTYTPDATATSNNYSSSSTTCTAAQSDEKAVISYAGNSPIPTS